MNHLGTLVPIALIAGHFFFASPGLAEVNKPVSEPETIDKQLSQESVATAASPPSGESKVVVEIPRTQWCQCVRGVLGVEGGDLAGCVKSGASEEKLKIFRQRGKGSGSSATVSSLLAFAGCSESENQNVGSFSFDLEWKGPSTGPLQAQAVSSAPQPVGPLACDACGISTVQAVLYHQSKTKLASINPWDCLHPVAVLTNIPAGSGIRLVMTGKNASGSVLYRAERGAITITYGERTVLGTITALSFVPVLSAPEHGAFLGSGRVRFAWTAAPGASSYQVQVSETPKFSSLVIDAATTTASYETSANLASAAYYWRVRATDAFSNTSEWSPPGSITVDAEPPTNTTADTFINKGAAATNASTALLALSAVKKTGVTGYFISENSKRPEAGKAGWVTIPSAASYAAEIPFNLSKGDGNKKVHVWFKDARGHVSQVKSGSILVDTKPPQTKITNHPLSTTNSTTAQFTFFSTKAGSVLHCALDGGVYSACTGTQSYEGLPEGTHTFSVKAIDAAGNTELSPAGFTWTIDLTPPHTSIEIQPPVRTDSPYARFGFSTSKAGSTFRCQIDGNAPAACFSPMEYFALATGPHTFAVTATDAVGTVEPTPARYTWTIVPPFKTTITGHPPSPSNSQNGAFSFASSWPGATYRCSLDGADYSACASPAAYTGLAEGSHTFSVKAFDEIGNEEVSPAQYTWVVSLPPIAQSPRRFINRGSRFPGYITDKSVVKLSLAAAGTKNIAGYYVSEQPDTPDAADLAWIGVSRPVPEFSRVVPFTLSESKGVKTVYVWFRDAEGNVSEVISDSIYYFNPYAVLLMLVVLQAALLM